MCLNTAVPKVDIAVRAQQWLSRCLVRAWLDNTVVLGGLELAFACLTGCLLTSGGEPGTSAWGEDLPRIGLGNVLGCRIGPSFVESGIEPRRGFVESLWK
jgi:hypothetical protein